jgi:hypothetical protein
VLRVLFNVGKVPIEQQAGYLGRTHGIFGRFLMLRRELFDNCPALARNQRAW